MFGFIVVNDADLTEGDRARYRQAYCGVCRALHERHGQLARLSLNHDMTFMALVHLSLYEPAEETGQMACPLHPVKKRPYTHSIYTDYAADMTVALMYFKCLDDISDEGKRFARMYARVLKRSYEQVKERWPRACSALERALSEITRIEHDQQVGAPYDPDAAANRFGAALAEIFAIREDFWARDLRAFGFELGRFIYLMDAAVDLPEDRQTGSYNPFARTDFSPSELKMLLCGYMERVSEVFERLPLVKDDHLLRSVIYAGVWSQFNRTYEEDDAKECCAHGRARLQRERRRAEGASA